MKTILENTLIIFNSFNQNQRIKLLKYEIDFTILPNGNKSIRIFEYSTSKIGYIFQYSNCVKYYIPLRNIKDPKPPSLKLDLSIIEDYDETEWVLSNGRCEYKDEILSILIDFNST